MLAFAPLLLSLLPWAQFPGIGDFTAPQGAESAPAAVAEFPDWMPIDVQAEVRRTMRDLAQLESELEVAEAAKEAALEQDDLEALKEVDVELRRLQKTIQGVEGELKTLHSLFHPPNLQAWAIGHGVRVLWIVLIYFLGRWAIAVAARTIIGRVEKNVSDPHSSAAERAQRANTLVAVFRKAAGVVLLFACTLLVLQEFGVSTGALLATFGLLGIAVSFGSQSLVKDFFSGFFILLENQFALGDIIKINNQLAGTVEDFTLRVTALRDAHGVLHFIPNGSISAVSNMTHGYSKVVLNIGVAYREDPDEVIAILGEVGETMRKDSDWSDVILEPIAIPGVDSFGENEVAIRVSIKTAPEKQWSVKREFLKRVKVAFDLNDIEIPFPQRVTYTMSEQPAPKTLKRN